MKWSVNKINKNPHKPHAAVQLNPGKLTRHPSPTLVNFPFSLSYATCMHGQLGQRALYAFFDNVHKTHSPRGCRTQSRHRPLRFGDEGSGPPGGPPRATRLVSRFKEHDMKEVFAPVYVQRERMREQPMSLTGFRSSSTQNSKIFEEIWTQSTRHNLSFITHRPLDIQGVNKQVRKLTEN